MRSRLFFILLILAGSFRISGNELPKDTIRLDGLTIYGQYFERFSQGSQIQKIDSLGLTAFKSYNLNDILKARAPVHFKSYGGGMLSSISFRGTGAGHTAVLWNGIQVNQPTIGQSDFSLFPVFAFDDIKIHYGAASSRYGSDAIGGGILLLSRPDWGSSRIRGDLGFIAGSYGKYLGTAEIRLRPCENLLLQTKAYRHIYRNNFKYENFTRPGNPVERQRNSSIAQYGILQDVFIRTSGKSLVSINGWFNFSDRQIQPSMTNSNANESQKDKSIRLSADYQLASSFGYLETKLGYLLDYMLYNQQSEIVTSQYIGQLNYETEFKQWKIIAGSEYKHITANSANYEDLLREDRISFFGGSVYRGIRNTDIRLNIRQLFVKGFQSPVAPSLGIRHILKAGPSMKWIFDGQASLNYRIPTLNDRFWVPGGRVDLSMESSRNIEGSVSFLYHSGIDLNISLSGYHYWIDDWILWIPGPSYWVPDNVRKVMANGLELKSSLKFSWGFSEFQINGYFSLARSIIRETHQEDGREIGNQLPYTPRQLGAFDFEWLFNRWQAGIRLDYTGKRYVTTDNQSALPDYILFNLRAGRNFKINRQTISIDVHLDNLLNEQYQSVLYRAMPGRTLSMGIHYLIQ